jgi:hypothetical protein
MANPNATRVIGGQVYVTQGTNRFELMADATIEPAGVEREASSSAGGRLVVTEKAVPCRAKLEFANFADADPMNLWNLQDQFNITIVEKTRGVRHLFTNASAVGKPEKNLATGVVTGVEIATDNYQPT